MMDNTNWLKDLQQAQKDLHGLASHVRWLAESFAITGNYAMENKLTGIADEIENARVLVAQGTDSKVNGDYEEMQQIWGGVLSAVIGREDDES